MAHEVLSASIIIEASADTIFAVVADPAKHSAIDGTGWVGDALDRQPLTASGQIFRMATYHPGHSNGNYGMANRVQVFDPPHAISWEPGYDPGEGSLRYGGWILGLRHLTSLGPSETEVTLFYDWSAVPEVIRATGPRFPPFDGSSRWSMGRVEGPLGS